MTRNPFKEWRSEMRFSSQEKAAEALGYSLRQIKYWENGEYPIPLAVRLAMRALRHNLEPWE